MHTYVKDFMWAKLTQMNTMHSNMRKNAALSFRIPQAVKAELEEVSFQEGRSLSQVCEALLAGGLDRYRKEGSKYLQRFLSRQKKEEPTG
jgi:hypothetical protein